MLAGCLLDMAFTLLIGPIMTIAQTVFIGGLCFGRKVIWEAQNRADRSVTLKEAVQGLWPQLAFGVLTVVDPGLHPARHAITVGQPDHRPLPAGYPLRLHHLGQTASAGCSCKTRLCAIPDELAPALRAAGRGGAADPWWRDLSASQPHTAE